MKNFDEDSIWLRIKIWSGLWTIRLPVFALLGTAYLLYAETTLWQGPVLAFGICLFVATLVMGLCISVGIAFVD